MDKRKKNSRYQRVLKQLEELTSPHPDPVSVMATIAAVLHHKFDYFFWTGFYLLKEGELTVGPYQGPVACIRLKKNTGVCWAGINSGESLIVPDVHKFPGHIACDSRSNSEIVVPLRDARGNIVGVMDVDSKELDSFDEVDRASLEKIVALIPF
ncbi:MAG: GAF domain-containing protein [Bacteroidales bacterium]